METHDGLKTIALTLFLNLFFYFLLQLLCVMISQLLTVLKHKMPSQILYKNSLIGLDISIALWWSIGHDNANHGDQNNCMS